MAQFTITTGYIASSNSRQERARSRKRSASSEKTPPVPPRTRSSLSSTPALEDKCPFSNREGSRLNPLSAVTSESRDKQIRTENRNSIHSDQGSKECLATRSQGRGKRRKESRKFLRDIESPTQGIKGKRSLKVSRPSSLLHHHHPGSTRRGIVTRYRDKDKESKVRQIKQAWRQLLDLEEKSPQRLANTEARQKAADPRMQRQDTTTGTSTRPEVRTSTTHNRRINEDN